MKPIAMRMTQKEFDSIKDLLPKITDNNFDLMEYPYLTNNYNYEIGNIGSIPKEYINNNRKVYEYFDRDIFLEACDIKVEKVFDGSEMQFLNVFGEWQNCSLNNKYRIKPQPDYSKEIESLQSKASKNGMKAIITFEKL